MITNTKRRRFFLILVIFLNSFLSLCYPLSSSLVPMNVNTVNLECLGHSPHVSKLSFLDASQVNYFSVIITAGNENTDKKDVNSLITTLVSHGWKESNIRVFSAI